MGSDGSEQAESKLSWLGRPPTPTAEMLGHDGVDDDDDDRDGSAPASSSSRAAAAADMADASSPSDQRRRVAIALDRMGAAVVEVRDAFQRWVPRDGHAVAVAAARSMSSPAPRSRSRRAVSFSDQEMAAGSSLGNKMSLSTSKEAMVRAMAELRLPPETAETFCKGVGGSEASGKGTFSDFVSRYAAASGLLKETVPSGKNGGGEVWVEGLGGVWVAVPSKKCLDARKVFDGEVARGTGDRDTDSNSDNGGEIQSIAAGEATVVRPRG